MARTMRTNKKTKGKFWIAPVVQANPEFVTKQQWEEEAYRRAVKAINRGFDKWQDLGDHESYEIQLSPDYLVRMDHFFEDYNTVYVDFYDLKSGNPPETIAEVKLDELEMSYMSRRRELE
jgi:hypothetical protein